LGGKEMKSLFECTTIKNMKLKNRFFKAAVWEELATEDGHMTDELFQVYEEIAKGEHKVPKCVSCNKCYKLYGRRCIFNSNNSVNN
jgi:hypothetical protein